MNPQTGEVLALVSLPSYDNNLFARGHLGQGVLEALVNNKNKPLTNHAVQAHYPPGSTFKLVAGTGGARGREDHPEDALRTAAILTLGGTRFYDWNHMGFGLCNIYCGFGHSSDTFFFQVAGMLGADRLAYWARQYGFGRPTGHRPPGRGLRDRPVTTSGRSNAFGQPMSGGEVYQAGIGQGYDVVTPIQLINAYAAIANGGKLYRPQLVREVVGPDGKVVTAVQARPHPQAPGRRRRRCARCGSPPARTVTLRHTYNLVDMPVKVAGKSGTAEFGTRDSKGRLPFHSWFVGFVPKNPYKADFAEDDLAARVPRVRVRLADEGNAGTEIAKAFLQFHFHIKKDYLNRDLLISGNHYQSN